MSDDDFPDDDAEFEDENAGEGWGDEEDDFAEAVEEDAGGEPWKLEVGNLFDNAEMNLKTNPKQSYSDFKSAIEKASNHPPADTKQWVFPSLQHAVILSHKFGNSKEAISWYQKFLDYGKHATENEFKTGIQNVLTQMEKNAAQSENQNDKSVVDIYSMTLQYLKKSGSSSDARLWFDFAMKLCNTYLTFREFEKCKELLEELHKSCRKQGSYEDDLKKGRELLNIYALKIQLLTAEGNAEEIKIRMPELFERTKILVADVNDSNAMSVVKDCWGKMYASMNDWDNAYTYFFEAFRLYQNIGHMNVNSCLKSVVISCMLSTNDTNPFATQEARVCQNHPEIQPISNLYDSFVANDIRMFESTIRAHNKKIMGDSFVAEHLPKVKVSLRSRVIVKLIKPYQRVKLDWLKLQLNATDDEIEALVVNLILDGSVNGKLDQINNILQLNTGNQKDELLNALETWTNVVRQTQSSVIKGALQSNRGGGMGGMPMDMYDFEPMMGGMSMPFMQMLDDDW